MISQTLLKKLRSLTFANNTAQYAGSALYGGTVEHCYTYILFKSHTHSSYYHSHIIFKAKFHYNQQHGDSPISSDPYGVCLCIESEHYCKIKNYLYPRNIYPGETFNISAVTVGQMRGMAHAPINVTIIISPNHSLSKIIEWKRNASKRCVTLTYVLHSKNQQETLKLEIDQSCPDSGSFYLYLPPP